MLGPKLFQEHYSSTIASSAASLLASAALSVKRAARSAAAEDTHKRSKKQQKPDAATPGAKHAESTRGGLRCSARMAEADTAPDAAPCFCLAGKGGSIHIATSGYSYAGWHQKGSFYPASLPQSQKFAYYSRHFNTSELNATFYGWQKEEQFDSWRRKAEAAGNSFTFVVKAQQYFTHMKRLNVDDAFTQAWQRFWSRCKRLRPHLGPVLFQFPANFATTTARGVDNLERLCRLGQLLPAGERFVFEFRHASWFCPAVYAVLKQHDWCLAMTHVAAGKGESSKKKGGKAWIGTLAPGANPSMADYPLDCCSWGTYLRFHGSEGQYLGRHGAAEMRVWADWAKLRLAEGREVWAAFNNTDDGLPPSAICDARDLAAALRANGVFPTSASP